MHDTVVRACFYKKYKNPGILTKIIPFSEKVREAKWRHKFPLSNANLLLLIFSRNLFILKEIAKIWCGAYYLFIISLFFLIFHGENPL